MKKSILYILIAVALSYGVRFLLYEGIRKNEKGIFNKFNTVFLKKNNFNTVFIGSSRAETHFDCRIFDSINKTNSYNLGMEGATVPFVYTVLQSYLQNSSVPKTVILSIDHVFRFEDADTVYMYPRYFPYLSNEMLYEGLKKRDNKFCDYKNIPLFSLSKMGNKYVSASLRGYFGRSSEADKKYFSGFSPLPSKKNKPLPKPESIFVESNKNVEDGLDSIISLCRKKNIELRIVISPVYQSASATAISSKHHISNLKKYSEKNKLLFFDYSQSSMCADTSLFFDNFHLNENGAEIFTRKFSDDYHNISYEKTFK